MFIEWTNILVKGFVSSLSPSGKVVEPAQGFKINPGIKPDQC